ncbi:zinc ribbon domain-containing protein [Celeribacter sp.]|uniref:zinc ribbon domain-containing protein n=1 Tax=Celeribacter sp. TaxID=1890673 RepID=UPI003A8E8D68
MIQCQSCGLPLKKDPKGGGTESDGARSTKFCSYCYEGGAFLDTCKTAKDMQDLCMEHLRKQGMLRPKAWLFTRQIPHLERWRDE